MRYFMWLQKIIIFIFLSSILTTAQIVKGGVVMNGGVTVRNPFGTSVGPPPNLEDNLYCGVGNIPLEVSNDGPASPPSRCYYTALSSTPSPLGQLQATVTTAAALQTELNNATCGEIIYIAAGSLLSGSFTFPAKGCDDAHYIRVRVDTFDTFLPPPGVRITPCYAGISSLPGRPSWPVHASCSVNLMAILEDSGLGGTGVINFANSSDHWRIGPGIWIRRPSGGYGYSVKSSKRVSGISTYVLNDVITNINVGDTSVGFKDFTDPSFNVTQTIRSITLPSTITTQQTGKPDSVSGGSGVIAKVNNISSLIIPPTGTGLGANNIILDRIICSGTPDTETGRCISGGSGQKNALIDSFLYDFHCFSIGQCVDSQAFSGGAQSIGDSNYGNWKYVNNYLESAGECWIFGGGPATTIPNDIDLRRNWCFKPNTWNPADVVNYNGGYPLPSGHQPYIIKNMGEQKTGNKVRWEGNVFTYSYKTADQSAPGIVLSPKNQNGNCSVCALNNIIVRYNRLAHMGSGMEVVNALSDSGAAASSSGNYSIHDLLFEDVSYALSGDLSTDMWGVEIFNQAIPFQLHDVELNHITMVAANLNNTFPITGPPAAWTASQVKVVGNYIIARPFTDPPTIFKVTVAGTNGTVEPIWPTRLSGSTITSGTVIYKEDSINLQLYLLPRITIKNSILAIGARDVNSVGGGSTSCANNFALPASPLTKLDACWVNYTFTNNVLYNGTGTWPGTNFFPVNGNSVGFIAYDNASGGNYQLCLGIGVPDAACTVGSDYASNGIHPADDGKDMGADTVLTNLKTFGVDVFN